MPSIQARIDVSLSTGDLDVQLGGQLAQLQQIAQLIARLVDDPPDDVQDLLDLAANLPVPEFTADTQFVGTLRSALAALPANPGAATGSVIADLARFATLIGEQIAPLLQDSVKIATAIGRLAALDFRCAHTGSGPAAGGAPPALADPPAGAEPAPDPAQQRLVDTAQQLQQVSTLLDAFPTLAGPGAWLEFLFPLIDNRQRNHFFQLTVPVFDDIVEPLRTLSRWALQSPEQLGAELVGTLTALEAHLRAATQAPLDGLAARIAAFEASFDAAALTAFANAYAAALTALVAALQAADTAARDAALAAMHAALDNAAPLFAAWNGGVGAKAVALQRGLAGLPDQLLDRITHLLALLEPVELPALAAAAARRPQAPPEATVTAVREAVQPVLDWLEDLAGMLDFAAVREPIEAVGAQAAELAGSIRDGLTGVTLQIQALFDDCLQQLAAIDLTALRDRLTAQIEAFGGDAARALQQAASPVADTLAQAVQTLSDALDGFDPAVVVDALRGVLQAITGVLAGSEVQGAVQQVRDTIAQIAATLEQVSFAPVTDQVVALIEQMTQALAQLNDTDLNDAAKTALAIALQVLPEDLRPVTDPLLVEFDAMIEGGPVPLLTRVADKPAQLLNAVTRFQPGALIGDTLGTPYRALLTQAEAFRPAAWFGEADAALTRGKQQLLQAAAPGRALALLQQPYDALRGALAGLSPEPLLQPLEQAVQTAVAQILEAAPIDEIFAQLDRVFGWLTTALDVPAEMVATLERLHEVLQGFADSDAQIDAWRDGLLDKALAAGAAADLDTSLAQYAVTVAASTHTALATRLEQISAPLRGTLATLAIGNRTTALVQAHQRARGLAAAQTDPAIRTAVIAALDRFDPSRAPALRLTLDLERALTGTREQWQAAAGEWQALTEDADSLLAQFATQQPSPAALRETLAAAMEPALAPLRYVGVALQATAPALAAMAQTAHDAVERLMAGFATLLAGPAAIAQIRDAIEALVEPLRNLDLAVVREGLARLHTQLQEQIATLDPSRLGQELNRAFARALEPISLATLIAPATVAQLDAAYAAVLTKLRSLDPGKLITDVVQPEYDQQIVPLLQAFDLTPAFHALIEFLRNLAEELQGEMGRVNGAYQSLRAARPNLAGIDISVNISF